MREEASEKGKGSCMRDRAKGCPSGRTGPAMEKVSKTPSALCHHTTFLVQRKIPEDEFNKIKKARI